MNNPTTQHESFEIELGDLSSPAVLDAFRDKVHYCCEFIRACHIDAANPTQVFLEVDRGTRSEVEAKVRRFATKTARGFFPITPAVVTDHRDRRNPGAGIVAELLDKRWLVPYASGCMGLQGPALALYNYLDASVLKIARDLSAIEASFPSLMELDTLAEANYLDSFPHHLTVAAPIKADMDKIESFVSSVGSRRDQVLESCAAPSHVLAPTVCIHAYRAMRNRKLERDEVVALTARGHCFRHERNRLDFAGRLWDFTMREIVFVGEPEKVEAGRAAVLNATREWLDGLSMGYLIETAADPFFVTGHAAQSFFQLSNKTKLEIRMKVEGNELAVGSFNYHREHFGKSFGISNESDANVAHSACVGFGLERLLLGFLAQLGTAVEGWPAPLQDALCDQNLNCF